MLYPINYYPPEAFVASDDRVKVVMLAQEEEAVRQALAKHLIDVLDRQVYIYKRKIVFKDGRAVQESIPDLIEFDLGVAELDKVAFAIDDMGKLVRPYPIKK